MTFTGMLDCDNAAFDGPTLWYEIARLLRTTADKMETGAVAGTVRDANGNTCSEFCLSP